ncbi:MAG: DUF2851 family protein [Candidatus Hydrogenedentes bacterium]|nr:DUF2851 family protein [Candidatus Hydrogenedentota bacterium]
MMFSEEYGRFRAVSIHAPAQASEGPSPVPESLVQSIWFDQMLPDEGLCTDRGRPVRVLSPGWWNRAEGPDFKGAQIRLGDRVATGDIEIHLTHAAWRQHGHHVDPRYNNVMLVVVLTAEPPSNPPITASGRTIPCLLLSRFLDEDVRDLAGRLSFDDYPHAAAMASGQCAALTQKYGVQNTLRLLVLAGEWRMLNKARSLRERIERVGADQALYESLLEACGFARFKPHFRLIAQQFPYERVRQLIARDPLLLEAALLQIAGLLPDALPDGASAVPHFTRLLRLRRDHLPGLRRLPLTWKRTGVRPNNYPERRLAGAARILSRTAHEPQHATSGLAAALNAIWQQPLTPLARRRAFEALFPSPAGFWAGHCSWTGKRLAKPAALLGPGRVRSIIGNVFIPAALAHARRHRDRGLEETVLRFFTAMPKEADNQVIAAMTPRLFGQLKPPPLTFRTQQGLIQVYQDWCEPNASCQNCPVIAFLDVGYSSADTTGVGERQAPAPRRC